MRTLVTTRLGLQWAAGVLGVFLLLATSVLRVAAGSISGGDLLPNSSFETNLACWNGWNGALSRVPLANAPDGSYVAMDAYASGSAFTLDSLPCPTQPLTAGATYTAQAFVEAASSASVGKKLALHVRELNSSGSTVNETASGPVRLSGSSFARLSISALADSASDHLDVYLGLQGKVGQGDAFYSDAISLVSSASPTASRSPSTSAVLIPAGDLLSNSTFATDTACWNSWQGTLSSASVGNAPADGDSFVAKIAYASGTAFTLDSLPCPTQPLTAGATYTAEAYVEAASSTSAGKNFAIHIRELDSSGTTVQDVASSPIVLSGSSFSPISSTATAYSSSDHMDVYMGLQGAVGSADAFYADAVSLVTNASSSKSPSLSPSPSSSPSSSPSPSPSPSSSPSPSPSPSGAGYITRSGEQLYLNGSAIRFAGAEFYGAAGCDGYNGAGSVTNDTVFMNQVGTSQRVTRTWMFQPFATVNGARNWTVFDNYLSELAQHNMKVIFVLADQWGHCDNYNQDGIAHKDYNWWAGGYKIATDSSTGETESYRQWVAEAAARYANNPTIAMWQLVNEGEARNSDGSCSESAALSAMRAFTTDMVSVIRQYDSNHLISGGPTTGECGTNDGDYQSYYSVAGNDVCDYHDYGYPTSPMGNTTGNGLQAGINYCHADGKPIMVAESGINWPSTCGYPTSCSAATALQERATDFNNKFSAQYQAGVVGELMWTWNEYPCSSRGDETGENFWNCSSQIYSGPDPSLSLIPKYAVG